MRIGYACVDITPAAGVTLTGFAARCDQPSTGVDDPIEVHALALDDGGAPLLVMVFDLLGLGPEVDERLQRRLDTLDEPGLEPPRRILSCTHTHSAPAAGTLHGCGVMHEDYLQLLEARTFEAARRALAERREARLSHAVIPFAGHHYNRRTVLEDGRVVLNQDVAGQRIVKRGPTWDEMLIVRVETPDGEPIVNLATWPAHPCTVCGPHVSADWPGEFRRRMNARFGRPFMFLQGACGNLNPPFREMTRGEMLANVDRMMQAMPDALPLAPIPRGPRALGLASRTVELAYDRFMSAAELGAIEAGMRQIADSGRGPGDQMRTLANILNVAPDEQADAALLKHIAGALAQWAREQLALAERGARPRGCALTVRAWSLESLCFCTIPAEVFAETALALRRAFAGSGWLVNVVGYGSPAVGYLPTDEAIADGGYEPQYAHQFFGKPGPFAPGSEPAVCDAAIETVRELAGMDQLD